jgi:hypothetical protein
LLCICTKTFAKKAGRQQESFQTFSQGKVQANTRPSTCALSRHNSEHSQRLKGARRRQVIEINAPIFQNKGICVFFSEPGGPVKSGVVTICGSAT